MPNRKQRMQNRQTAAALSGKTRRCPECGAEGDTCWMSTRILSPIDRGGFWTCEKFYTVTGRRDPHVKPTLQEHPDEARRRG